MIDLDFTGQTALVTGASRGIGHRIATDLARCGATLVVTSTTTDDGPTLVKEFGAGSLHMAVDFTDWEGTRDFLKRVRELTALHVCVNNAGATRHGPFDEATETDWDITHEVDLKAPYFVSQAAADVMKRDSYGRIVNISSIWGHMTMAERSIYTAAKFGLRGMSLGHAVELARFNVLVNVVSPGFTLTDMVRRNYAEAHLQELEARVPMGRLGTVEDVSSPVLFLASRLNTYITGQSLVVDGGYSIC